MLEKEEVDVEKDPSREGNKGSFMLGPDCWFNSTTIKMNQ